MIHTCFVQRRGTVWTWCGCVSNETHAFKCSHNSFRREDKCDLHLFICIFNLSNQIRFSLWMPLVHPWKWDGVVNTSGQALLFLLCDKTCQILCWPPGMRWKAMAWIIQLSLLQLQGLRAWLVSFARAVWFCRTSLQHTSIKVEILGNSGACQCVNANNSVFHFNLLVSRNFQPHVGSFSWIQRYC